MRRLKQEDVAFGQAVGPDGHFKFSGLAPGSDYMAYCAAAAHPRAHAALFTVPIYGSNNSSSLEGLGAVGGEDASSNMTMISLVIFLVMAALLAIWFVRGRKRQSRGLFGEEGSELMMTGDSRSRAAWSANSYQAPQELDWAQLRDGPGLA